MTDQKRGYIDVDTLQRELSAGGDVVEKIATFYRRDLPALHRTQDETRLACHFACGKEGATGDRAISVKTQADGAVFRCFQYGCTVRGNLLALMYWMKHDRGPSGEKLYGAEFREIAHDLQTLVRGETQSAIGSEPNSSKQNQTEPTPLTLNVPLKDSENERARELVTLDDKFVMDVAAMTPKASAYVRRREFLTPELMKMFRCGYLPNDAGSLLRGHFVYGWSDASGDVLTWFGRNLNFDEQHKKWRRSGGSKDEPSKFRFVKGFHRGLELYGEDIFRREANAELLRRLGIVVVEGPNDVISLNAIGIPAVAVCSNTITAEQAEKLMALAQKFGGDTVSVMFDLDREGENGAKQAVLTLAERCTGTFNATKQRLQVRLFIQAIVINRVTMLRDLILTAPVSQRIWGNSQKRSGLSNREVLLQILHTVGIQRATRAGLQNLTKVEAFRTAAK